VGPDEVLALDRQLLHAGYIALAQTSPGQENEAEQLQRFVTGSLSCSEGACELGFCLGELPVKKENEAQGLPVEVLHVLASG
jgi:hypothetical protein